MHIKEFAIVYNLFIFFMQIILKKKQTTAIQINTNHKTAVVCKFVIKDFYDLTKKLMNSYEVNISSFFHVLKESVNKDSLERISTLKLTININMNVNVAPYKSVHALLRFQ